jgi:hypothetical protein
MKKLNLLLIVSMLAAALLAANPPGKLVRLEVINASGDTVYMKLQGRLTGAFYYLTIPKGWIKTFTVLVDSYARTTWACGGMMSRGSLNMTGNVKLKFILCGKLPTRTVWSDMDGDGIPEWDPNPLISEVLKAPNFGEPTQEKVVFYDTFSNVLWRKLCHGVAPAPCTWWWFDPIAGQWKSASVWIMIKLPFAVWQRVAFSRGRFMRYRY